MGRKYYKVNLIKRKRQRYTSYITRYFRDGKATYGRSFHDKRLAEGYANALEQFINGDGPDPDAMPSQPDPAPATGYARIQFADAKEQWLSTGRARAKTRIGYRSVLKVFAEATQVEFLDDVTERTVSDFLDSLRRKGHSLPTIALYARVLRAFFNAVRPDDNPVTKKAREAWRPYAKREKARPHYFTPAEFNTIIAACDLVGTKKVATKGRGAGKPGRGLRSSDRDGLWWKTLITLLHDCGLRIGEATNLIWRDVDFAAEVIRVQPHDGLPGILEWRPKGKQHRAVPMTPQLSDLLAKHQGRQPEGLPYVFLSSDRYATVKARPPKPGADLIGAVDKGFRKIRRQAGVAEGSLHDWRRTAIINWLEMPGLTPRDVQLLAGHDDLNTTLGIYVALTNAQAVDKVKKIIAAQAETAAKT